MLYDTQAFTPWAGSSQGRTAVHVRSSSQHPWQCRLHRQERQGKECACALSSNRPDSSKWLTWSSILCLDEQRQQHCLQLLGHVGSNKC